MLEDRPPNCSKPSNIRQCSYANPLFVWLPHCRHLPTMGVNIFNQSSPNKTRYTNITLEHSTHDTLHMPITSTTSSAREMWARMRERMHTRVCTNGACKHECSCGGCGTEISPPPPANIWFKDGLYGDGDDELRVVHTTPTTMRTCSIHVFSTHVFSHSHTYIHTCAHVRSVNAPEENVYFEFIVRSIQRLAALALVSPSV